ncbi:MAG: hypothetical protein A2X49_11660 [Lentisphaerae bacterium GWF2_52_8]|nr:MAG: hypothetical protein A2X49_11660 [Lentisphaerae bacterium GWF2_52_8]
MNAKMRKLSSPQAFTLIEILMVTVITMVLFGMLMPGLKESRARAKFIRWYGYNQQWNRDTDCVVNYNFQDGKKSTFQRPSSSSLWVDTLRNGAEGCDWAAKGRTYNARDYDGLLCKATGGSSLSYQIYQDPPTNSIRVTGEMKTGGRWGWYKQALNFDGQNTVVRVSDPKYVTNSIIWNDAVINSSGDVVGAYYDYTNGTMTTSSDVSKVDPMRDALDFSAVDPFTIVTWIKFETPPSSMQAIYARECGGVSGHKSPGDPATASSQYDMFTDFNGTTGSFDVELSTLVCTPPAGSIDFKNTNWQQVVLRYTYPTPAGASAYRAIDVFINGKKISGLGGASYTSGSIIVSGNPIGRAGSLTTLGGYPWYGYGGYTYSYQCKFKGLMDEFVVFKRALSDKEVQGTFDMGSE